MSLVRQLRERIRLLEASKGIICALDQRAAFRRGRVRTLAERHTSFLDGVIWDLERLAEVAQRGNLKLARDDPAVCEACGALLSSEGDCRFCESAGS